MEKRLSLYWWGFVASGSSSRAVESHRQSAFLTNDNERSILINGSSLAAIVWQLTFTDCFFFSHRPVFYIAIRMGGFGFFRDTCPWKETITPIMKREGHVSKDLLLQKYMMVCVKCFFSEHICLLLRMRDSQSSEIISINVSHSNFLHLCFLNNNSNWNPADGCNRTDKQKGWATFYILALLEFYMKTILNSFVASLVFCQRLYIRVCLTAFQLGLAAAE